MKLAFLPSFASDHIPGSYPGLELLATAVLLLTDDSRRLREPRGGEPVRAVQTPARRPFAARSMFGDAPPCSRAIDKALATGASYTEQELELVRQRQAAPASDVHGLPGRSGDATLLLEFRHIDQQLKIAREERLLEQQQANREPIRSLAHEIKNPLGGIRGAAQLLERELDRPPLIEYTQVSSARPTACNRSSTDC